MGKRSPTETVVAVLQAFLQQRVWKQVDLAQAVDLTVPALRTRLEEMERDGVPFEREEEHPHVSPERARRDSMRLGLVSPPASRGQEPQLRMEQ